MLNTVRKYLGGDDMGWAEGDDQLPAVSTTKLDRGPQQKKIGSVDRRKGVVTVYAPNLGRAIIDREYEISLSKHRTIHMKDQEVEYEVMHYNGGCKSEVSWIRPVLKVVSDSSDPRTRHLLAFMKDNQIARCEERSKSRTLAVCSINEDSFQVESHRWGKLSIPSDKFKDFNLVLIGDRIKLTLVDGEAQFTTENIVHAEWDLIGSVQGRVDIDEYNGFKHVGDILCRDDFHRMETHVSKVVKSLKEGDYCKVEWVASVPNGAEPIHDVWKRFKKRALNVHVLKKSCPPADWAKPVDIHRLEAYAQSKGAFCTSKRKVQVGEEPVVDFGIVKIGEVTEKLVKIFNENGSELILCGVTFDVEGTQNVCDFSVTSSSPHEKYVTIVPPNEQRCVPIKCLAKLPSKVTVTATFVFELLDSGLTVRIGKLILVEVRSASGQRDAECRNMQLARFPPTNPEAKINRCSQILAEDQNVTFISIGKESKQKPPFFKSGSRSLPSHTIPSIYLQIYKHSILEPKSAAKIISSLHHKETWNQNNTRFYKDRMEVALWFEEIERRQMRKCLDLYGIYLSLQNRNQSISLSFQPPASYIDDPIINIGDIVAITPREEYHLSDANSNSDESAESHPRKSEIKAYKTFIDRIEDGRIFIKIAQEDLDKRDWCKTKVDVSFHTSRMQFIRMHHALSLASSQEWLHPPNERKTIKSALVQVTEPDQGCVREGAGKRIINSGPSVSTMDYTSCCASTPRTQLTAREASCFKVEPRVEKTTTTGYVLQWFNSSLNKEQKAAVKTILKAQFRPYPHIIYGPPGTGKTVTLVEAITQVFHALENSSILITATSNAAADVLAERLVDGNVISLEHILRFNAFHRSLRSPIPTKLKPISLSDVDLESSLKKKRIVICTLSTAGQYFHLNEQEPNFFSHVFIDEAGYAAEVETLIGCVLASGKGESKIILAGDPRQLGPVVFCKTRIAMDSLERSLMLRLMTSSDLYIQRELRDSDGRASEKDDSDACRTEFDPLYVSMLTKSYRLPRGLVEVPSELFYYNQLEAVYKEDQKLLADLTFLPRTFPLIFLALRNQSERPISSPSWLNPAQAEVCVDYVLKLRTCGILPSDIAILALYRSQVEFIRKELRKSFTNQELPIVATVHEFQGNEKKVIILSTVVSNIKASKNAKSFLRSELIFNVAITRAKGLLIAIGDPEVLKHQKHWKRLMKYALNSGVFQGCNAPEEVFVNEEPSAVEKLALCFEEQDNISDGNESSESNADDECDW